MAGPCWNTPSSVIRSVNPQPDAQLDLFRQARPAQRAARNRPGTEVVATDTLTLDGLTVPVDFVRDARARVYRLMLRRDGTARVTLPRWGALTFARSFLQGHTAWLANQAQKFTRRRQEHDPADGRIWFRGERVPIELLTDPARVRIGTLELPAPRKGVELSRHVDRQLLRLARTELTARTLELAAHHAITVPRVSVRSQRTRWGSCARHGLISLNWRLVQAPEFVRDYVILHELAHRRHLNHSARFWTEVKRLCPDYERAETWLKTAGRNLL
jgi:predicted metal-dependent hydrolase